MTTILDSTPKQYEITGNTLTLWVRRSPIAVLIFFSLITTIAFLGPLIGVIVRAASGDGLHVSMFFGLLIGWLIAFYLLRNTLWSSFGKETLIFSGQEVSYTADYKWFKDKVKTLKITTETTFDIRRIGYEDDHEGALIVSTGKDVINCASKMDLDELNSMIKVIESKFLN